MNIKIGKRYKFHTAYCGDTPLYKPRTGLVKEINGSFAILIDSQNNEWIIPIVHLFGEENKY